MLEMQPSLRLLELQAELDRAVLRAYAASTSTRDEAAAWNDLTGRAEPNFLDEVNETTTLVGPSVPALAFRDEFSRASPSRQGPAKLARMAGEREWSFWLRSDKQHLKAESSRN